MSKTIDERVVSMQFDNKKFESNVSTTMSTLDKLKQKLNLTGSAKGLENIGAAAKKVDLSGLINSADKVGLKFNAMYSIADQALRNITTSAMVAGKRIVTALALDPIKTGFNEYELKMNSVQTIMASTGEELATVNKYLEELNAYSDQTIYSFSDMTQNIGKFTNAGVKLEDAVLAIKGISNEAALSGANANEASRAMYNFAQALSVGYIQRIDWKSIELANMATVEFKEQLLNAAIAAGTVQKSADGMYSTLANPDKAYNAAAMFTETLDDQWLTNEVLIGTLKDYADETTDIGARASKAATEVKTFSQMCDTLKESAQSGWAKTWELIFGDFYEGKTLWTAMSEAIGGVLDKISDFRNTLLESALGRGFTRLGDSVKELTKPLTGTVETVEKITGTVENLGETVDKVMRGDFGNGDDRLNALTEAGINYYRVQNKVNEVMGSSFRYTEEQIEAQDKLLGTKTELVDTTNKQVNATSEESKETSKLTESTKRQLVALSRMTDEQLIAKGYTDEQITALRELDKEAEKLGLTTGEFIMQLDEINGRWLLINSFKNIGQGIAAVVKSFGEAFKEIFGTITSDTIYDLIAGFHKLTT